MHGFVLSPLMRAAGVALLALHLSHTAFAQDVQTIDDYNARLIMNGVSWKAGSDLYFPSFYTGFAPRMEDPNRIHFRLARGNQIRLTVPLDELSVLSYLYNLKTRDEVVGAIRQAGVIKITNQPQADFFAQVLASPTYGISSKIDDYENQKISRETFYQESLATMKALNPGRIFALRFDMARAALEWRAGALAKFTQAASAGGSSNAANSVKFLKANLKSALVTTNDLLFGRVNAIRLSEGQIQTLARLMELGAQAPVSDEEFVRATIGFFSDVTAGRYEFRVVDGGRFRNALECASSTDCTLVYDEFTAIYPNGSVLDKVSDRDGNSINRIREVGAMRFVERGYHDVDHIRPEPYYGWIPKMDYTMDGNGIHNSAVRTSLKRSQYKFLYEKLGVPSNHKDMWLVARGGVSHGCTRMSAGHVLEVRNVFPSDPKAMTKVYYFGSASTDYDVFDVDGDGRLEVMGVDYLVMYELDAPQGDGYRSAKAMRPEAFDRELFYPMLYGSRNQYYVSGGQYVFTKPYVSYFNGQKGGVRAEAYSVKLDQDLPLYEQAYEKDKLQFYDLPKLRVSTLAGDGNNFSNKAAQVVRFFGRINGCGPFAREFSACGEQTFRNEMKTLLPQIKQ